MQPKPRRHGDSITPGPELWLHSNRSRDDAAATGNHKNPTTRREICCGGCHLSPSVTSSPIHVLLFTSASRHLHHLPPLHHSLCAPALTHRSCSAVDVPSSLSDSCNRSWKQDDRFITARVCVKQEEEEDNYGADRHNSL